MALSAAGTWEHSSEQKLCLACKLGLKLSHQAMLSIAQAACRPSPTTREPSTLTDNMLLNLNTSMQKVRSFKVPGTRPNIDHSDAKLQQALETARLEESGLGSRAQGSGFRIRGLGLMGSKKANLDGSGTTRVPQAPYVDHGVLRTCSSRE